MKKNLRATAIYTGCVVGVYTLLILGAMVPKQIKYQLTGTEQIVTEREYRALKKPGIKVKSNYTILAILLLMGSVPLSVMAFLIVSNRLPEVELEAEEYYKAKRVRKLRTELELQKERELCEANNTTAVEAHKKDLESAFIELAEASNWYASEPETRQQQQLPATNAQSVNQQAFLPSADENEAEKKSTLSDEVVDTFGVSEIGSNQPVLEVGLLHPSETKAKAILNQLALSRKSLLLIAGTGGGKSVTQAALISILKEKQPQAEFWVVSQKNDSFCGLKEKSRVTIFDINQVKKTLDVIHHVWGIYNTRRQLDEEKRKNLSPVRLLLADWFSISLALEKLTAHPDVKDSNYLVELVDIVLNGRDFNVCLWADLQSFNLKAIGMKADNNSRQNFNLIGLGNYYTTDEGVNDSYGVLSYMIQSQHIISDKDIRVILIAEFEQLRPISQRNERPIIFSTLEPASVCLQADVRHYQRQYQNTVVIELDKPKEIGLVELQSEVKSEQESEVERLERIFKLSDSQPDKTSSGQLEPLSDKVSEFIWTVRKVRDYYQNQTPEQLFVSVADAARSGKTIREIVRSILKLTEGPNHPTRSYTQHGKTLLMWLIANFDNGDEVGILPEIQRLFQNPNKE